MTGSVHVAYDERFARRGFTALRTATNRYQLLLQRLAECSLGPTLSILAAPAATERDILTVHDPAYLDLIQHLDLSGEGKLDGSTPAWRGMYARAERVVGASLLGADLLADGRASCVFNPAGGQHHAHVARGGGFCVFNDVVIAARRLQARGIDHIAVLDLDGHHGDGTAHLLLAEDILCISLHQFGDRTYPGTGDGSEVGGEAGTGFTVDLPLAKGTGSKTFLAVLRGTVEPLLRAYRPEILILEFGTDGHAADPLLRLRLSTAAYAEIAGWVHRLAHELCGGKLLILGGGGYEPEHTVRCWLALLAELAGVPLSEMHPRMSVWLDEPPVPADPAADSWSAAAAASVRSRVFPFHGLRCPSARVSRP